PAGPPPFPYTTLFRSGDVEGLDHRAVEVAAERDVADAHHAGSVPHRAGDGASVGSAGRFLPVADTDQRAVAGELVKLRIGKVARSEEHTSELQSLAYL